MMPVLAHSDDPDAMSELQSGQLTGVELPEA